MAGYKAFANKIWNAARFSLMHMSAVDMSQPWTSRSSRRRPLDPHPLPSCIGRRIASLEGFRFNDASTGVYQFIWHELCDWYIELVKPRLYEGSPEEKAAARKGASSVLDGSLRLLHPFMPFVTEEIWQKLPREAGDPDSIMLADYPMPDPVRMADPEADRFDTLIEMVQALRSLRVDLSVPEGAEVEVYFDAEPAAAAWLSERASWMKRLAKVENFVHRAPGTDWPAGSPGVLVEGVELRVPLSGLVNREELLAKLGKDALKLETEVMKIRKRLDNPGFVAKAPPEVIVKDRALADEMESRLAKVRDNMSRILADPAWATLSRGSFAPETRSG